MTNSKPVWGGLKTFKVIKLFYKPSSNFNVEIDQASHLSNPKELEASICFFFLFHVSIYFGIVTKALMFV